jgi:hypothetical protein
MVTEIHASLYGYTGNPTTSLTLSLQDALTGTINVFASANLSFATGGGGLVSNSLPVNTTLSAGTYYLVLSTGGFVGWGVSDGTFVTTAGTVADGAWQRSPSTGNWTFVGNSQFSQGPGVFAVYGPDSTEGQVPEPCSLTLLATGSLSLLRYRRRKQ